MNDLVVGDGGGSHEKEHDRDDYDGFIQYNGNYNSDSKDNGNGAEDSNDVDDTDGEGKDYFVGVYTDSKNKPNSENGVSNGNEMYGVLLRVIKNKGWVIVIMIMKSLVKMEARIRKLQ